MNEDAKKRLEAIEILEDLGSGFTLSNHDLEIRGAGELLGKDQSGKIQAIGFSYYNQLLEKAVLSLKTGSFIEWSRLPSAEDKKCQSKICWFLVKI